MPAIHFETKLFTIDRWTILQLPEKASAKLPSRGQVMVRGTVNGHKLETVLEPDGKWSHWFKVDKTLRDALHVKAGDKVTLAIEASKDWPEPKVPADLKVALEAAPRVYAFWKEITPLARWDWIRWVQGTNQAETRKRRVKVAISKMKAGEKRPCCFNRAMCTDPDVSKGGVLREPAKS